jgi:3-phenylpropionate/cinnamic acid dioxygenase small subunit
VEDARAAITNLVLAYAERIDHGDFDGVGELFADAVVTAVGDAKGQRGRDEVRRRYEQTTRRYEDGTPKTKHVTTNLIINLDDEAGTATCRSYYTVFQAVPGVLPLQPIIAGRYEDRFERIDGRWRFAARHILVDLIGDLSQHLLFDLRAAQASRRPD